MRILFPMHSLERGGGCRVVAEAANGFEAGRELRAGDWVALLLAPRG